MATIIPIRDLKDTAKVSKMCHESEEPIYITKNGYGYIADALQAPDTAVRMINELEEAILSLETLPHRGTPCGGRLPTRAIASCV